MKQRREIDGEAMWNAKQAKAAHAANVRLAKATFLCFFVSLVALLVLFKCAQ